MFVSVCGRSLALAEVINHHNPGGDTGDTGDTGGHGGRGSLDQELERRSVCGTETEPQTHMYPRTVSIWIIEASSGESPSFV